MKVLVYGCSVIGSYLVHVLCKAGNAVTVVCKGRWGEIPAKEGLHIHHQLQLNNTVDYPNIAKELPDEHFDHYNTLRRKCKKSMQSICSFC